MKTELLQFCARLILCASCLSGVPLSAETGFACVADMTIPEYRGISWLALLSGEATASILVGPHGTIAKLDVKSGMPGLGVWLKASLSRARFLDSCEGQTVILHFVYRLIGDPEDARDDWPRNEVKMLGGETLEITAAPPTPRVQP